VARSARADIVARLSGALKEGLAVPDGQQQLESGGNVSAYSPPEALGRFLDSEFSRYERVVKAHGIKPVN